MKVKELMVPVAEDRSLYDALNILEAHRKRFARKEYRPRVVLVHDADFNLIGGLDHTSFLKLMAGGQKVTSWDKIFTNPGDAARTARVKDAMTRYGKDDHIDDEATLSDAMPKLLQSKLHNLIVTSKGTTTGILRTSDVFNLIMSGTIRPIR